MDETSPVSRLSPHPPDHAARAARGRRPRLLPFGACVVTAGLLLGVSACGSPHDVSSSGPAERGVAAASLSHDGIAAASGESDLAAGVPASAARPQAGGRSAENVVLTGLGRSQIKSAEIGLHSSRVATVVAGVEGVASSQGGFVANENTVTNIHGVATSSSITIRVPVDTFETAVAAVSKLGQLADRRVSTQDVTGRVADVDSRVASAKDAITQLRLLFSHATKLSDIITLESELQARQTELEALLAQQRALTNETTLSTISVQVSRPPTATTLTHHEDQSTGFIGGLKQGWDALATTFVTVSHGLGAALPLGLTLLAIAALLWAAVRRIPRRRVGTSE